MGLLSDRMDRRRKWFAKRGFFERETFRDAKQLIGTHDRVPGEATVYAVSHASAVQAEDKISGETVLAPAASDGRGSQTCNFFADGDAGHTLAQLDHPACELMPKNHGRVIPESIVQDVDVGSTHPAERNLHFHLLVA